MQVAFRVQTDAAILGAGIVLAGESRSISRKGAKGAKFTNHEMQPAVRLHGATPWIFRIRAFRVFLVPNSAPILWSNHGAPLSEPRTFYSEVSVTRVLSLLRACQTEPFVSIYNKRGELKMENAP
jgi:hypothetical protein